jgi:hypothetical protein
MTAAGGAEAPLLDLAAALATEAPAAAIEDILGQLAAAELGPIAERRVLDKIKQQTTIPLGMLAASLNEAKHALRAAAPAGNAGEGGAARGQGRPLKFLEIEPWPEPVDGAELFDELARTIREYVILSLRQAETIALWSVFTHVFDAFDFSPKLVIRSAEKRSGKTRLVEVLERLTRRPFFLSGISAAALLRMIEQHAPTMLIDEIDTQMKGDREMAEALRGLINSGFDRAGARFVKNVPTPDGGFEPRAFSTWCPMLFAGIGKLPDTVADRSIAIEMIRKRRDEKVKRLRTRDGAELRDLGAKAARWAADNLDALKEAPKVPEQLNDRAADAWSPLLAIAEAAGGDWPERARRAAVTLAGDGTDDDESTRVKLLADIRAAFVAPDADRITSEDLAAHLVGLDDRPWPEYRNGKSITKAQVARLLKPLHIRSGTIRLADGRTAKGYYRAAFEDSFARYLPGLQNVTPSQAKESAAFGDFSNVTSPDVVTFRNREDPSNSAGCDVVTDRDPQEVLWTG